MAPQLIVVTRPHTESLVHTDATESEPRIKPHLINPEIFFGKGSLIVEGPSDYFVQKAVSDFYDGWFEICDIVLMGGEGADSIPRLLSSTAGSTFPTTAWQTAILGAS